MWIFLFFVNIKSNNIHIYLWIIWKHPPYLQLSRGHWLWLALLPQCIVRQCVFKQLLKDVHQNGILILSIVQVRSKFRLPLFPKAVLLGITQTCGHDPNGHIQIVISHRISKMHSSIRLGHSKETFNVSHGNRYRS